MRTGNPIFIIDWSSKSEPVSFGKEELLSALKLKASEVRDELRLSGLKSGGLSLLIGETSENRIMKLLQENEVHVSDRSEGVIYQWCNTEHGKILVVSGTDETGLMYALLELADRVRSRGSESLLQVRNLLEYPDNRVRGVDRFIMSHRDDEWFYSGEFWEYFLKRLARCRFNRFTLITGFDTAYMSPPYPFFVEVPGFPDVSVKNMPAGRREKNLEILNLIGRKCKAFGIEFIFSTWQQKPWTKNQEMLIENMPDRDEEFTRYCAEGMHRLVLECPWIAGVQLRVNMEAGITADGDKSRTHVRFWCSIVDAIASAGRPLKLSIRAKGLTDSLLEYAMKSGLEVEVPTKYWCEHAALPYHIPQLRSEEMRSIDDYNSSRRYSYGNLLKKPHEYKMIYRLWNYGSTNLFLWGDPDYCRRFSKSAGLGDAAGFQINSPLSLKGGHELIPGDAWPLHINREVVDYRWEDERYGLYYLAFGRMGYKADTDDDVWVRELEYHYCRPLSLHIGNAFKWASRIMPLITTAHFPVHPSLHYWPELYSGAALFSENNYETYFKDVDYSSALPGDEALFYSIRQYVDDRDAGALKGKYNPLQVRDWLKFLADNTREALWKAVQVDCKDNPPEFKAAQVDFGMLADIAEFHAWKIKAAYHLYLYQKNGSSEQLKQSSAAMLEARRFWASLSELGNKYYNHNLEFNAGTGTKRNGNWNDRLVKEIDADIASLKKLMTESGMEWSGLPEGAGSGHKSMAVPASFDIDCVSAEVPASCKAERDLPLSLKIGQDNKRMDDIRVFLHYRHTDQTEGGYLCSEMERLEDGYQCLIPANYMDAQWDLIVFFSIMDKNGYSAIYPGINHPVQPWPYFVIRTEG